MVAAAIAKAEELGCKQNVAVVDDGGNLKAFGRMDGAPLLGVEGCQRKAFTALFGVGTQELYNAIKEDQSLVVGLSHFSRATMVGGVDCRLWPTARSLADRRWWRHGR